jgi:TrmH family RNA methyltransferase
MFGSKMITSLHNPQIQAVRRLQTQAKARRQRQEFIIEGVRLAEEALHSGWPAHEVFFTGGLDERGKVAVDLFSAQGVAVEQVSDTVMKAISQTQTPQGILAILVQKTLSLLPSPDFLLILDELRDPGNMGTILRTAAAAGTQAVLLAPSCADPWSPKVVRSAMGAHFHLPLICLSWQGIQQMLKSASIDISIYLADSAAGAPYTQADFCSPLALIVGGEAAGAGNESLVLADAKVHIPMPGGAESLNAAIAAGILLFEVVRQRASRNLR